jgi:ligand-binding SRPBCC domain-containing protein
LAIFCKSVVIDAPVAVVFGFHEREEALALLTPPFPPVKITRTGGIEIGARVVVQCGPFRWVARHSDYERNRLFVDEQIEGPLRSWVHHHQFEDLGGRTRLTDYVEYQMHGGPLMNVAVHPLIALLFRYRHRVTREQCGAGRRPAPR